MAWSHALGCRDRSHTLHAWPVASVPVRSLLPSAVGTHHLPSVVLQGSTCACREPRSLWRLQYGALLLHGQQQTGIASNKEAFS